LDVTDLVGEIIIFSNDLNHVRFENDYHGKLGDRVEFNLLEVVAFLLFTQKQGFRKAVTVPLLFG
jgi:hypothetical protein